MVQYLDMLIGFSLVMLLLSLIIMIVVQAIGTFLQMRGDSLLWGVRQTLEQMGYDIDDAEAIADKIIRHPALSSKPGVPATALRFVEFVRLLPTSEEEATRTLTEKVERAVDSARRGGGKIAEDALRRGVAKALVPAKTRIGRIFSWFERLAARVGLSKSLAKVQAAAGDPDALAEKLVKLILQKGGGAADNLADQVKKRARTEIDAVVARAREKVDRTKETMREWFDMVMDRSTERFVNQTRRITVGIAFILAFALHVDALDILSQLQTNPELRAQLVAQAQTTVQTGEDVVARVVAQRSFATETLTALHDSLASADPTAATLLEPLPSGLATRGQGEAWLLGTVPDSSPAHDSLLVAYNSKFDDLTREWLTALRGQAASLTEQLGDTKLVMFELRSNWLGDYTDLKHLGGTLVAALLLSLGAPFWFNALKNLSNLRPVIARNVQKTEDDEKQRVTSGTGGQEQVGQDTPPAST